MARDTKKYTLLNAAAPRAIASSTNTSPIVVTTAAPHGYSTGQKVTIVGHATNTNANASWVVTVLSSTTFELDGSSGNGVGGASGTYAERAGLLQVSDFRDIILAFDSDGAGDAALVAKVVGSIQDNVPDFAAPVGPDNQYDFLQMLSLEGGVAIDGDDGIVLVTEDINRMYEVNVNGVKWLSVVLTDGTIGELTVRARLFGNI